MTSEIKLQDAFKGYTRDQDKILPPEETVRQLRAKLQQLDLEILDQTVRIDNGRLNIPVFFSYCGRDAAALTGTKKQMGKGATPDQAEASAVMELAERFSFFSFANNPANFITAPHRELTQRSTPFEVIAASVHDTSPDLAAAREIFESLPLKWTRAFNLTRRETVLVPFDWFYAINAFNGPSAGNCVEEALCQGICEIVERHTSSIVSHKRLNCPAINPDSASDALVKEMLDKYRRAGIKLYATDFTLEMGIPTIGVLAYDPATFPTKSEIVWTAGTTPDPQKALSRALTEVAQLAGDFNSGTRYVASGLPKFTRLEDAAFVTHPEMTIDLSELPNISSDNIRIEVERCIAELSARNLEVFAVDTTHPLLGVPAFYTIVPGAHFRERALNTGVGMFSAKLLVEKLGPARAVRELERFETRLPGKYYTSFYRGTCHLTLKDPQLALRYFRQALERQPGRQDTAAIYAYMGIAYKDMEDYRLALSVLEEGEKYDPERTDVHNLMGFCHFKLKAHAEAIACFKKVIALDPSSAIDYANIASNYRDLGQKENAVRYYLMALEIDPSITFARENLEKLAQTLNGPARG
ncbi:MAG: YcaO-like family protein [Desulfobacterales bacterium]|jgi:ribosomal protein S12 methylthiotransferase accessory factor